MVYPCVLTWDFWSHVVFLCCFTSPVCSTDAEAAHLVRQGSVSIAAIVSIKPCGVVVLSMPCSIPVPVAVVVVGFGVSVVQVSRLGGLWGLRFRGVRWFTAVAAISAGDGTEILKTQKRRGHIKVKFRVSKV